MIGTTFRFHRCLEKSAACQYPIHPILEDTGRNTAGTKVADPIFMPVVCEVDKVPSSHRYLALDFVNIIPCRAVAANTQSFRTFRAWIQASGTLSGIGRALKNSFSWTNYFTRARRCSIIPELGQTFNRITSSIALVHTGYRRTCALRPGGVTHGHSSPLHALCPIQVEWISFNGTSL
jgi:hypothetical protein